MVLLRDMESEDEDAVFATATISLFREMERSRKKKKRIMWTKPWISNRMEFGIYHALVAELQVADEVSYRNFLRMDLSSFEELLHKVGPLICKENTIMRRSIAPEERLALTLRWLASGEQNRNTNNALFNFFLKGNALCVKVMHLLTAVHID